MCQSTGFILFVFSLSGLPHVKQVKWEKKYLQSRTITFLDIPSNRLTARIIRLVQWTVLNALPCNVPQHTIVFTHFFKANLDQKSFGCCTCMALISRPSWLSWSSLAAFQTSFMFCHNQTTRSRSRHFLLNQCWLAKSYPDQPKNRQTEFRPEASGNQLP